MLSAGRITALLGAVVLAGMGLTACGDDSADTAPSTTVVQPTTAATTTSAAVTGTDSIDLTLSGGLNGKVTQFLTPPFCKWIANTDSGTPATYSYEVSMMVKFKGKDYVFAPFINGVKAGKQEIDIATGSIAFYYQAGDASDQQKWNNYMIADKSQLKGSITLNDDHSGSIDATLPRQEGLKGGPLTIRGTWSCASWGS